MNRGFLSLFFGLLLAASILTPQSGAQQGVQFEMPRDEPQKKNAKTVVSYSATLEVLNGQSAKIESLVDGDAVKLKVTMDRPTDLAHVAKFKFADDEAMLNAIEAEKAKAVTA